MNKKRRERTQVIIVRLQRAIKRAKGQETARYQTARYGEKRRAYYAKLTRRVYQTGEWWLLEDVYERLQARAYFTIVGGFK